MCSHILAQRVKNVGLHHCVWLPKHLLKLTQLLTFALHGVLDAELHVNWIDMDKTL